MLEELRFHTYQVELKDWCLVSVSGADRESFFQGQVTNDLDLISVGDSQITTRLNRTGKIQSFFYISKLENKLELLVPRSLVENVINDFNKYIIMEEVELFVIEGPIYLVVNPFINEINFNEESFNINFYGLLAKISNTKIENLPMKNETELERLRLLSGFPKYKHEITGNELINETFLNEIAISYKKGCFLGQETASKIENNRGAATFPVLIILNQKEDLFFDEDLLVENLKIGKSYNQFDQFLFANVKREYQVEGKKINFDYLGKSYNGIISYFPYFKSKNRRDYALELFDLGTKLFQEEKIEQSIEYLKLALVFDQSLSDAYEVIGVILGRLGKYEEAISWMDKLLIHDQSSVMAHTNKSLFLMKLGKISEAEEEKSLATVKTFSKFGEEAQIKKKLAEEQNKKESEMLKREGMFKQVLEIDPDDTIALYGMADIFFYRNQFSDSIINLKKVIQINSKYSMAYLLLGKSYEAISEVFNAREIYNRGIEVAAKNGDMMPANEMQARLNKIRSF